MIIFNKKAGISILGLLVLAGIVILVLSYFNISIRSVVQSPAGQDNITYVQGSTENLWTTYLQQPASYLWHDVWVKLFWQPFIENIQNINAGRPTNIQNSIPQINFTQ